MLTEPLIQQLSQLRLHGMAQALERQIAAPDHTQLSFEDRLGLMIQHEITERATFRLAQRLRWARLPSLRASKTSIPAPHAASIPVNCIASPISRGSAST